MKERTIQIISEILGMDSASLLPRMGDKTVWDSLQRVNILFALEDEFDLRFSEGELAELATPGQLCEAVERKTAE